MINVSIKEYPATGPIIIGNLRFENIDSIKEIVDCKVALREAEYLKKGLPISISKESHPKEMEEWKVTCVYALFPCFDIYDSAEENRFFNNFIFHKGPVSEQLIADYLLKIPHSVNYCMATIKAPSEFLPIVYYADGSPTVLVCEVK